jgi:hypothetical protein
MRGAGIIACKGERLSAYRFVEVKPEGKRPLRRPRREGNIEWIIEK